MFKSLKENSFVKNALKMSLGALLGQLLGILAMPFLTRFYTPSEHGVLSAFTSILLIISNISSEKYDSGIHNAKKQKDIDALVATSTIVLLINTILVSFSVYIFNDNIVNIFKSPLLGKYLWLLPIIFFFFGGYSILKKLAVKEKMFGVIAKSNASRSLTMTTTQVIFGFFNFGALGLLLGYTIGMSAGNGMFLSKLKNYLRNIFKTVSWKDIKHAANTYKRFPLIAAPASTLNAIGSNMPILMFTALYGIESGGFLLLAIRCLSIPMNLIGIAVGQVYIGEISASNRKSHKDIFKLFKKVSAKLFLIGTFCYVFAAIASPFVFSYIFGESWGVAGDYIRLLSIFYILEITTTPLSNTLNILEKHGYYLIWNIFRVALVCSGMYLAHNYGFSDKTAIAIYSVTGAFSYAVHYLVMYRVVKIKALENTRFLKV